MSKKLILIIAFLALAIQLRAQTFKPVGVLKPPKGYAEKWYSNQTLDGSDFIKMLDDKFYIKAYSDTSIHIYNITPKGFVYHDKVQVSNPVSTTAWAGNLGLTDNYLIATDRKGANGGFVYEYDGRLYVFAKKIDEWSLVQEIRSPNGTGDAFGDNIDVTDSIMTITAPYNWVARNKTDDKADRSPLLYRLKSNGKWAYLGKFPKQFIDKNTSKILTGPKQEIFIVKDNTLQVLGVGSNNKLALKQKISPYPGTNFFYRQSLSGQYYANVSDRSKGTKSEYYVQIYKRTDNKWVADQLVTLPVSNIRVHSVSIDGHYLAVGLSDAPLSLTEPQPEGRVLIYTRKRTGWQFLQEIRPGDSYQGDKFGHFVLLKGKNLIVFSEVHFDYQKRKKELETKKDVETIKKLKHHGDIYLYRLK